jgi:(2Fe-2S) ferredoxin
MRQAPFRPQLHFFVCANQRAADSPLGAGCGERGVAVFSLLKACVAADRAYQSVWVTQTGCLGVCPKQGATVAVYGLATESALLTEVTPDDARRLYDDARASIERENGS